MEIIKNGFENKRLGIELDVYIIEEKEWFKAQDIGKYLEYRDTYNMTRSIDFIEDNSYTHKMRTPQGNEYEAHFINEVALYEAILKIRNSETDEVKKSRYNKAREFQKWVFLEVLPSLRKNNYYIDEDHVSEEQYNKLIIQVKELSQQNENFSNILINNTRKSQSLKTYLEQMFPTVKDAYTQFLDNMKKAKMLDENYYPTSLFSKHNARKNMFKYHQTIGFDKTETFSLTNLGMEELAKRLFVEDGVLKIKKEEVVVENKDDLVLF